MKNFNLGVRVFVGAAIVGILSLALYLLARPFLYVYGYPGGNPPWLDFLILVFGPVVFAVMMVGLVWMYGD